MRSCLCLAASAALVLLTAACQAPRSVAVTAVATPPIPYPAETKRRILAIADREWREFGGPEIDYTAWLPQPIRPGLPETDPRVFSNILAYWNAVRGPMWERYIDEQKMLYRAGAPDVWAAEPWSAVFVSYVMRSAGIDRDDFAWHAGHRDYVDAIIERQRAYGADAVFQIYDVDRYAPEIGDLVCADRSRPVDRRITTVAEREAELGRPRAMHCDIVIEVEPGRLAAIGGNVGQSVTRAWLPLDASGRLLRRVPPLDAEERTFFAVIRTNIADPRYIAHAGRVGE